MYSEHEVQRVLRAYEGTVSVDIHCSGEGDWWALKAKDPFSKVRYPSGYMKYKINFIALKVKTS